jgi:hypothetical protein
LLLKLSRVTLALKGDGRLSGFNPFKFCCGLAFVAVRSGVRPALESCAREARGMGNVAFRGSIEAARKWHALAERRRRHYVELYRSERWRRYFKEETFLALMRDAIQNAENWAKILERMLERGDSAKAA